MTNPGERFAIYFAPDAEQGLWSKASSWLGRDAATAQSVPQPEGLAITGERLRDLTAKAAGYGFHGTLTAPFELAAGTTAADLATEIASFASERQSFELPLEPAFLGSFLALRPVGRSEELQALHEDLVRTFSRFRARLSASDLERRSKGGTLTEKQMAYLQEWGYPYVFEDFRFHMTLSKSIAEEGERADVMTALQKHLGDTLAAPVAVDRLALFHQPSRSEPFSIMKWFPFGA